MCCKGKTASEKPLPKSKSKIHCYNPYVTQVNYYHSVCLRGWQLTPGRTSCKISSKKPNNRCLRHPIPSLELRGYVYGAHDTYKWSEEYLGNITAGRDSLTYYNTTSSVSVGHTI